MSKSSGQHESSRVQFDVVTMRSNVNQADPSVLSAVLRRSNLLLPETTSIFLEITYPEAICVDKCFK